MDLPVYRNPNNIPIDFQEACVDGDLEKASNILVDRQDFSILDAVEALPVELLDKAMLEAARSGKVGLAEKLLNMGARVDPQDCNGATPLHIACANGPLELVQILLKHNAIVNKKDKWNYTPLHDTLDSKAIISIVEILLENGADIDARNGLGQTPLHQALHIAVSKRNVQILKCLIANGANINKQNGHDETPLHWACSNGYLEGVIELLKHNAEVNTVNEDCAMSPLHSAANGGHLEIVQELLNHNANIDFRDIANNTALHIATENGYIEIVKTLLENGCDTAIKADTYCNDEFFTALEVALEEKSIDVMKMIAFHEN